MLPDHRPYTANSEKVGVSNPNLLLRITCDISYVKHPKIFSSEINCQYRKSLPRELNSPLLFHTLKKRINQAVICNGSLYRIQWNPQTLEYDL